MDRDRALRFWRPRRLCTCFPPDVEEGQTLWDHNTRWLLRNWYGVCVETLGISGIGLRVQFIDVEVFFLLPQCQRNGCHLACQREAHHRAKRRCSSLLTVLYH